MPARTALAIALVGSLFVLGCQARSQYLKAPLEEDGEVYLYLDPLASEAERLAFTLDAVAAVRDDGAEYPLELRQTRVEGGEGERQRLLASGRLPPGEYVGFSLRVGRALLRGDEVEGALLVAQAPARTEVRYRVERQRAGVLSLALDYAASVSPAHGFAPAFRAFTPARPAPAVMGLVANAASHSVTVFDKQAHRVVGVLATGREPRGVALDVRQRRAYVALSGEDAVLVVDLGTLETFARIRLDPGDEPQDLALTSDGRTLLATNAGSNTVSLIDPRSLLETARVRVGDRPTAVLPARDGRRAFVWNTLASTLSVLDVPAKAVVATIAVEPGPACGDLSPRGDVLYAGAEWSSRLLRLDSYRFSLAGSHEVGRGVRALRVDPATGLLYLGRTDGTISVYEPLTLNPIDAIAAAGGGELAIDGDENALYAVDPVRGAVSVVNLVSKRVIAEFDVGESPQGLAVAGERQ